MEDISGTDGNDLIVGTDDDDEIRGLDGDDELRGGAGNDILIGGAGSDFLYGGSGADRCVIEFLEERPDTIMDFRPEEGDTVSLSLRENSVNNIIPNGFRINSKSVITYQMLGGKQVVDLNRQDLILRADARRKEIRLEFTVRF